MFVTHSLGQRSNLETLAEEGELSGEEEEVPTKEKQGVLCDKCEGNKPPRAHHCKYCNRCVAKMDHHCGVQTPSPFSLFLPLPFPLQQPNLIK